MTHQQARLITLLTFLAFASFLIASNPPANLSLKGIAEWVEIGGHIASGTGALPAIASAGARYTDLSVATAPVDYRSNGSSWVPVSGSGSGVSSHSELTGLDFASAGHTGFASSDSVIAVSASLTDTIARVATAESDLAGHLANQVDPHGASQTISESLTIGSGTADTFFRRYATGVAEIATWALITPSSASPTSPASGTLWNAPDGLRIYDRHGSFSTLLASYPVWNDLRVPLLSTNAGGTNAPTPVVVRKDAGGSSQGVFAYRFSDTQEQELYCSVQLPHGILKTHAHAHIHWITPDTTASTTVWGIEYSIANVNATYPVSVIATAAGTMNGIQYQHLLTEFPEIDLSSARDSSVILIRVFRDATNGSDTAAACWASDFDLHVQFPGAVTGSVSEYGDN